MLEGKVGACVLLHGQMTLDLQRQVSEKKNLWFPCLAVPLGECD